MAVLQHNMFKAANTIRGRAINNDKYTVCLVPEDWKKRVQHVVQGLCSRSKWLIVNGVKIVSYLY